MVEYDPKARGKSREGGTQLLDQLDFKRGDSPEFRFTVLRDTREQQPWQFTDFGVVDEKLDVGDYSIGFYLDKRLRKLDRIFVVERKASPSEMLAMVGQERERWQRELAKLKKIIHPFIIVECSLQEFLEAAVMSGVNATSAFGSVVAWQKYYPLIWAGSRELAKEHFLVLARLFYKKYILGHRKGKLGNDA
jgi:ERCC4-type nuclease